MRLFEEENKAFDCSYRLIRDKIPDIKFPCSGGRYYKFLCLIRVWRLYLYLTEHSLVYTRNGVRVTEIPFKDMRKLSIKRGIIAKYIFHIRFVTDKKHHFFIYCIDSFSSELRGNAVDNAKQFITVLQESVNHISL